MAKQAATQERNIRESALGISKQIDVNFRNYALYVLEHRGIPSFYDALTNVQRVGLQNAPKTFSKTISLVGSCISDGYHHGDAALSKAINKLAKPFACGEQLLLGDGYFGTPVNPAASATRYTAVKINPAINEILSKYSVLNKKNDDDQWEWLRTEIPIGLLTTVVGIAVGYKSTILPRKMEEIQKFLDKKPANLNPHFKGFTGKIMPYNGLKKTWLIEGKAIADLSLKTIRITDLPPLMKYDSFIKKLGKFAESNVDFSIQNDSADNVDITLKYKGGAIPWEDFMDRIDKMIKIIVTETLIFVKDNTVVEYGDISQYLTEFRVHREAVRLEKSEYDLNSYNEELDYLLSKVEYLKFMLEKKRTDSEIEEFLTRFKPKTKTRLERILLKELSTQSLSRTEDLIKEINLKIENETKTRNELNRSLNQLKVDTAVYSKSTTHSRSIDLTIDGADEIEGIEVFGGNIDDENEENNLINEEGE